MKKENLDNKDLGGLLFDYFTKSYKADINKNNDLVDYLQKVEKEELLYLYLVYGYAGNNDLVVEEIVKLEKQREKKK